MTDTRRLTPDERRRHVVAEAKAEADAIRERSAARQEWTGADVRAFLTMLAAREGVTWIEGQDSHTPEGPAERACDRCGTAYLPKKSFQRFCSARCREANGRAIDRERARRAREALKAAG